MVDDELGRTAIVAAAISMVVLPFLGRFVAAVAAKRRRAATPAEALVEPPEDVDHRVIIVGYGRVGALIGDMLDVHKIPFIAVDADAGIVANARGEGRPVYFGDATRAEFLRDCGIETRARARRDHGFAEGQEQVVEIARELRPDITLVARARDAEHARTLYRLGVTDAVPETIEASLQLSEAVLVDLGVPWATSSPRSTRSATNSASSCSPPARPIARPRRAASRRGNNHQPIRMKMRAHRLMASEAA